MFAILVAVLAVVLTYLFFAVPFRYWKDRGVPQYGFWTAWYETFVLVFQRRSISDNIQKIYNDFPGKRFVGQYQFFVPVIAVRDLDLIKQIAVKDFDHFPNHINFVPEGTEALWEKNLFSLKGDKWREMRGTLSPSFTGNKMKILFGLVQESAKQFVRYFEDESRRKEIEMKDVFTRFTNDVIASAAFGVTCDSLRNPDNEFYVMGKGITDLSGVWKGVKFFVSLMMPKVAKFFGIRIFDEVSSRFFVKLLKENIAIRENQGISRPDMLNLLLEAKRQRGQTTEEEYKRQITDEDIIAQALIFFFAGFDSVSTLMCFMAYELVANADVQQKLQREVDDTLKGCGGNLSYEDLGKMKYMDMVVLESLRKWPGALATDRVCDKPYTVQPVENGEATLHFNKGDALMIPIFAVHRDPDLYPEPDRFNPERFNDDNKADVKSGSFLAFGFGPRSCIGNRFALMETKLVFFHLLRKFDLVAIEKTVIPVKISKSQVQLTIDGGLWIGLKLRNHEI